MRTPAIELVARHAMRWLVGANAVGVLLAALLLWPDLNGWIAPFTYGRWMPLHMDWQLYGWCALPLVGALLAWYLPSERPGPTRWARWAVRAWSAALVLGGCSWLAGNSSGKLFLDWSGWARPLLPAAMGALWCALALAEFTRSRGHVEVQTRGETSKPSPASAGFATAFRTRLLKRLLLAALACVPIALMVATSPAVYPSVNPDSGGATGASLLASTLGIVAIAGMLPHLLGLQRSETPRRWGMTRWVSRLRPEIRGAQPRAASFRTSWFWVLYASAVLVYLGLDHGDVSHHAPSQIIALGTLMIWGPALVAYYRSYSWPVATRAWNRAAAIWWFLLLATGWLTFLPGISEYMKFTHALVAHAHLALGGLVTSAGVAILAALDRPPGGGSWAFWSWQAACATHVTGLTILGLLEPTHPTDFFAGAGWVDALLGLRLATGLVMLAASIAWTREVAE